MKSWMYLLLAISLFSAWSADAGIQERFRYGLELGPRVEMDAHYGPDAEEVLDVVPPRWGTANRGAVVVIHGGGWSEGDKLDMSWEAQRLAQAGFTVFNINYRLGKAKRPSSYYWPAMVVDSQLAVRWARANASRFDIDPERICAVGGSAGGHLSMWLGYAHAIHPGDQAGSLKDYSPSVSCVVNISGPANLVHPDLIKALLPPLPFTGKQSPEEATKVLRDASVLRLIDGSSAPTLVIQGKNDTLIIKSVAEELVAALGKKKVPHQYLEYEGGHVFIGASETEKEQAEDAMVAFVQEHLVQREAKAGAKSGRVPAGAPGK